MFTGIITDIGTVSAITHGAAHSADTRLALTCGYDTNAIALGDSIACDGICLTVVAKDAQTLSFDASAETLACTTLKHWQAGQRINLEQAMRAGDRLGGHFVTGHVDATTTLRERTPSGDSQVLTFDIPPALARFVAEKGSITLDGVSLTVNAVEETRFLVNTVAHTHTHTTLGALQPGDSVNLEIDMIARYLDRLHHADN